MSRVNRWLLPDGVKEVLPPEAARIESLRRTVVDLYQAWVPIVSNGNISSVFTSVNLALNESSSSFVSAARVK